MVYHQVFLPLLQLPSLGFKQQPDIMKYARVLALSSYWRLTSLDLHMPKQLTPIHSSLSLVRNHQQPINDPQKWGFAEKTGIGCSPDPFLTPTQKQKRKKSSLATRDYSYAWP